MKSPRDRFESLLSGDRFALSKAITLVESRRAQDHAEAQLLLELCEKHGSSAFIVAVTGPPGVGKSTLIEQIGSSMIEKGKKVAVLAIDPSSSFSGGSILGDKSRMLNLSHSEQAFVRPSPDQTIGGGVAAKTYEAALLCATAGFETILLETVGVGQSETAVYHLADMMVLMVQPGAGDELQSIKRGIIEMADLLLVSKADGDHEALALQAVNHFEGSLGTRDNGWQQNIQAVSATTKLGLAALLEKIESFKSSIDLDALKRERSTRWLRWRVEFEIAQAVREVLAKAIDHESTMLRTGEKNPSEALAACRRKIQDLVAR